MNEELVYYYKYSNSLEITELVKLTLTSTGRSNVYICNYEINKFELIFLKLHNMLVKVGGIQHDLEAFMSKKAAIAEIMSEIVDFFSVLKVLRANDPDKCALIEYLFLRQTMKKEEIFKCLRALVELKSEYAIKESFSKNIIVRKKDSDLFSGEQRLYNDHLLLISIFPHSLTHIYDQINPETGECIKDFLPITAEEYAQKIAKFVVPAIITTINEY